MLAPTIRFQENPLAYVSKRLNFINAISGKHKVIKEQEERDIIIEAERAPAANVLAQICAMSLTTYESIKSSAITAPTLVIHGTEDPIFPLACGRDIADTIPKSIFLPIEGMGHTIPQTLYTTIIEAFRSL